MTDWVNRIGLDIENAYHLSWDDKYLPSKVEINQDFIDQLNRKM